MQRTVNVATGAAVRGQGAASPQAAPRFGPGRVLRIVLGSLCLLTALSLVAAGGVGTWALGTQRDGSGYLTMAPHRFQTSSRALVSESLDVSTSWPTWALADRLGRIRIAATSTDRTKPLFVGIARTGDVERYLAGVEYDEVGELEIDPFGVEYRRVSGSAAPASPAEQRFWRVQAAGTGTQTVVWPVEGGDWSAVVMNADGSPAVSVDGRLAARVSNAWWIVGGLFVLGGLLLAGGGALVYAGVRRPAKSDD